MGKGFPRSLSRGPEIRQEVVKKTIPINEVLTFTGATGVAVFATTPIEGFAEGNILLLGSVANLTFTGPTSADLADDFQGDVSIGSTPASDNTLTAGDVDIIASTAIAAASGEVSSVRATNAAQAILDNTAGDLEMNLNVLLDANEVTNLVAVDVTVTGLVTIAYIVLGDD